MKSFALDENGDLLIEKGQIQMAYDAELTAQKLKSVFGTQKGEWFLNWEEGINRNEIFGKRRVEDDAIKAELQDGAYQVDENLTVDEVETDLDQKTRELHIYCTVINSESGERTELNEVWR